MPFTSTDSFHLPVMFPSLSNTERTSHSLSHSAPNTKLVPPLLHVVPIRHWQGWYQNWFRRRTTSTQQNSTPYHLLKQLNTFLFTSTPPFQTKPHQWLIQKLTNAKYQTSFPFLPNYPYLPYHLLLIHRTIQDQCHSNYSKIYLEVENCSIFRYVQMYQQLL